MIVECVSIFNILYEKALNRKLKEKCCIGEESRFYKTASILTDKNKLGIQIGKYSHIRGALINISGKGNIVIGDWCYLGEQSTIWSSGADILIGNRVLIAKNVSVINNNSHPVDAIKRHEHYKQIITQGHPANIELSAKDIVIEDDVWIGCNAIILKGIKIGKGSIVAAGSVVTKDVPRGVMVAGNPAVIKRNI